MLLNNGLDNSKGLEVRVLKVAFAVADSRGGSFSEASFCGDIDSLVLSREKATSQWVIYNNIEAVATASMDQFDLDVAS